MKQLRCASETLRLYWVSGVSAEEFEELLNNLDKWLEISARFALKKLLGAMKGNLNFSGVGLALSSDIIEFTSIRHGEGAVKFHMEFHNLYNELRKDISIFRVENPKFLEELQQAKTFGLPVISLGIKCSGGHITIKHPKPPTGALLVPQGT